MHTEMLQNKEMSLFHEHGVEDLCQRLNGFKFCSLLSDFMNQTPLLEFSF